MATYHVICNNDTNVINAGTTNKKGDKWINHSPVTRECLEAVRDHFLNIARQQGTRETGFKWDYANAPSILLKLVIEENKEEKKEAEKNE